MYVHTFFPFLCLSYKQPSVWFNMALGYCRKKKKRFESTVRGLNGVLICKHPFLIFTGFKKFINCFRIPFYCFFPMFKWCSGYVFFRFLYSTDLVFPEGRCRGSVYVLYVDSECRGGFSYPALTYHNLFPREAQSFRWWYNVSFVIFSCLFNAVYFASFPFSAQFSTLSCLAYFDFFPI